MLWLFHSRIRHPLYPSVRATPAASSFGHPMALAGTFQQLAHAGLRRVEPRRAVFVLQNEGDPLLNDAQRDELWELFQVPVYVLVLDRNRRVCAYECEAHQGLHLPLDIGPRRIPPGVETSPCGCGRPGPRLRYPHAPHTGLVGSR
ncbi:MAG TPA: hypothetical protein VIN93_08225 [Bryobacteraceae bacterium]